jgi:hypothetical protein
MDGNLDGFVEVGLAYMITIMFVPISYILALLALGVAIFRGRFRDVWAMGVTLVVAYVLYGLTIFALAGFAFGLTKGILLLLLCVVVLVGPAAITFCALALSLRRLSNPPDLPRNAKGLLAITN